MKSNSAKLLVAILLACVGWISSLSTGNATNEVIAWKNDSYTKTNTVLTNYTDVIAISAGAVHNLGLRSDGTVFESSVSGNGNGQLTVRAELSNIVAIAVNKMSGEHNDVRLALNSNGTVAAWGFSFVGATSVPAGLSNVVAITADLGRVLALKDDGTVVGWGENGLGQISVPPSLSNATAIATSGNFSLALKTDGTVIGWGSYSTGANVPAGLSNVVAIAAGRDHSLALKADGKVVAWGSSFPGQLNALNNLSNVVAISSEGSYDLALKSDGTIAAWGYNYSPSFYPLPLLTNVIAISAAAYALFLTGDRPPTFDVALTRPIWSNNTFTVSISSRSGKVYRLEYKNSVEEMNWTALPLVAGNGGIKTLTDSTATGIQRFYRVR